MLHRVLPAAPAEHQEPGQALLRRVALRTPTTLVHGDLAAHHVTSGPDGDLGVIDWKDARVADPAVDLGLAAVRRARSRSPRPSPRRTA